MTVPATPRATARLQFHKGFTLADATTLVGYFHALGISHIYASPLLTSRPGSTHGYDIVDHNRIDPELGGEVALQKLVAELRAHGMGLILDIVPNHMGVGGADNAWWLDVLEWGRASPYATYFDIDWEVADPALRNRMLAPFLGEAYGTALEEAKLTLRFDATDGRFVVDYGDNRFPINPRDYPTILQQHPALASHTAAFAALSRFSGRALRHEAERARAALAQITPPEINTAIAAFDANTQQGRTRLHALLEAQSYRLAWWRAAGDEINWRRFFDVNGLAGIRAEQPEVFEATHATIFRLYREGLIDGVRVDHVDGLADPRAYCRKLRRRLESEQSARPAALQFPAILWVEKILAHGERLPRDWLTDGTTGYDFMNDVSALFHAPEGEAPLTTLWQNLTGRPADFEDEARLARRQILRENLSSELFATARALHRLARRALTTRDYTLTAIRRALEEVLTHFVAYRIYASQAGISEIDAQVLQRAFAGARRTLRNSEQPLLETLYRWLSGEGLRQIPAGPHRQEWRRAMVRFQQLSAPTAAKSVEDTAFYRYGRLLSRNEVGSEPNHFALSPAAFHALSTGRRRFYPAALLATATHDHKRGEDARARLAVLSEIPAEWEACLARWMRLNAGLRRELDGTAAPDEADEIMLYQTILGAFPYGLAPDDTSGMASLTERVQQWQSKAMREAKRRSEWAHPNEEYENACFAFSAAVLDPSRSSRVVHEIAAFAARLAPAGALNALGQTLLRMTTPGIPDLYQGCEYWDLSLVDPDNRRPVDYKQRQTNLAHLPSMPDALATWQSGIVKQVLIARTLAFRARHPDLFALGTYRRLTVTGPAQDHLLAFARTHQNTTAVVLVSRLAATQCGHDSPPILPASFWKDTRVTLPRLPEGATLTSILHDAPAIPARERIRAADLLQSLPVAVLA